MGQEPGTNQEIQQFCAKNYGVSFIMMGKINVQKTPNSIPSISGSRAKIKIIF